MRAARNARANINGVCCPKRSTREAMRSAGPDICPTAIVNPDFVTWNSWTRLCFASGNRIPTHDERRSREAKTKIPGRVWFGICRRDVAEPRLYIALNRSDPESIICSWLQACDRCRDHIAEFYKVCRLREHLLVFITSRASDCLPEKGDARRGGGADRDVRPDCLRCNLRPRGWSGQRKQD